MRFSDITTDITVTRFAISITAAGIDTHNMNAAVNTTSAVAATAATSRRLKGYFLPEII
jgi:hypothetical protein